MTALRTFGLTILIIVLLLFYSSVFTVREGQTALLLRLGEIVKDSKTGQARVEGPGIHFKIPFINQVRYFDTRLQTLAELSPSRILTQEQKYVLVDYYVKWRISDLPLYYQRTGGNVLQAQVLLRQQLNDALRAAFGKSTITDVVSNKRGDIMSLLTSSVNTTAKNLGIEVIDVRIKSVDLPKEVSETVFGRMRSEREQVATHYRAEGKAQAEKIQAAADAKAAVLLAKAKEQAAQIRANGQAQAASIYAAAYNKDPAFYAFYRSLEAYKNIFHPNKDILILRPNGDFFKYFNNLPKPAATK